MKRALIAILAVAVLALPAVAAAEAIVNENGKAIEEAIRQEPPAKRGKLAASLTDVAAAARSDGAFEALETARDAQLRVIDGRVQIVVEASDGRAGALQAIADAGGIVQAQYANLVQAFVRPSAIDLLAHDPRIGFVRGPLEPHAAAAVPGEGVVASGAAPWHLEGRNGAGVRIAVIDAGFAGLSSRQASGDVPAGVTTVNHCAGGFGQTNHGTAVTEIVHEMAPGAQLTLICIDSEVTLGVAKDYVKAQGIPIVNTSLGWVDTSRGDGSGGPGTPDAIVTDARNAGVLWATAAGNEADAHWSGTFVDSDADQFHNFTPTDEGNTVVVPAGSVLCAKLKWDNWPVSAQDYDLYIVSGTTVIAAGDGAQSGTQAPREEACVMNTGTAAGNVFLAIHRYAATMTPRFDLWAENHTLEYRNAAGSINEPASAPAALAVGAACWQSRLFEPYSSQGPTIDGRVKPDIAGYAAVSSATYGLFAGCATSGFTGTSAAAPHVAGAAALVKQANPGFNAGQLQSFLESRALDLGSPGKDNVYGTGALTMGSLGLPTPPPAPPAPPTPPAPPAPPAPPIVDRTPPNTVISVAPRSRTRARSVTFRFRSSEAGSTFQCKLDRRAWTACGASKTYRKLLPGLHTFRVAARDAAGNIDPTPASRRWRIVR